MTENIDVPAPNEIFWAAELDAPLSVSIPVSSRRIEKHVYPFSKKMLDVTVTVICLLAFAPVFIAVAIAVKLSSSGPVFHKQVRVGRFGQRFEMWKFRTMIQEAERMLDEILHLNEAEGKVFKMREDPRVTKVGKFLRKYSLDELPQFINVIKGDMSLVGNRPPLPIEVREYNEWERQRLMGVPGITGLWQVSGRSKLSFSKMVELDVRYHNTRSLPLDLLILAKTIPAVFKGDGAY